MKVKPTTVSMRSALSGLIPILVIMGVMTAIVERIGGVSRLRELISQTGPWAPFMFVVLKAATFVVAPLSGTPLKISAGTLFGVWYGSVYLLLGDIIGGSINFWASRLFGRTVITKLVGVNNMARVDNLTLKLGGWRVLLLVRMFLSTVYDFASYAAGLTAIPFHQYVIVSAVGGFLPTIFWATFGASFAENRAAFLLMSLGLAVLLLATIGLQNHVWSVLRRILKLSDGTMSDRFSCDESENAKKEGR